MTLSGYTGTILKWQSRVNGGAWTDIANTTTTYAEIPATAGTWEYRAVVHNAADMFSLQTIVDVSPVSVGGTVTGGTNICAGNTSGVLMLSGQTGNVVKWQSSVSPFSVWSDIANTSTTYTSGLLAQTTQFRAVVLSGNCTSDNSAATTVTVDPVSVGGTLSSGVTQIYLGQTTGTIILSGYTGTIVKWQERLGSGPWVDIINATNTLTGAPNGTGTWEYRSVVQSGRLLCYLFCFSLY